MRKRNVKDFLLDYIAAAGRNGRNAGDAAETLGMSVQYVHFIFRRLEDEHKVEKIREARLDRYGIARTRTYYRIATE